MSAITHQKSELVKEIKALMAKVFDLSSVKERRDLAIGLANSVAYGMTLAQLKGWQELIEESLARRKKK